MSARRPVVRAPEDAPGGTSSASPRPRAGVRGALALAGPILFTPPALALADREAAVLGVPILVLYVLGAWLVGILLTFLVARSGQ